jgi:hypothetical protein
MSDLCSGVILVVSIMTLIFFGPELGKSMRRRFLPARKRFRRSRTTLKKGLRIRTRRINLFDHFAHS